MLEKKNDHEKRNEIMQCPPEQLAKKKVKK